MGIRYADAADLEVLSELDRHIAADELRTSIHLRRVLVAEENGRLAGWLRYNLFWDNTPFMNLLYIPEPCRGRGIGRRLTERWEREMAQAGYTTVMTSTQSNEYAQHFYFKLGYEAIGGFRPEGEGYEVIFAKRLTGRRSKEGTAWN